MTAPNPLAPAEYLDSPYPNIVSLHIRENASVAHTIEAMRKWIANSLVPFINENVKSLSESWVVETTRLIETWEALSEALVERVDSVADGISGAAEAADASRIAAEAARDMASQFASQAQAIQDQAITAIFSDLESNFRNAVNAILNGLITEDEGDPGTFTITVPEFVPSEPSAIVPDPADPGFFV